MKVYPLGYTVILRDHAQPALNRNAGEYAPTWELRTDVMHRSGRTTPASSLPWINSAEAAHGHTNR